MDFVKGVIQPYSNSSNTKEDYLINQINDYIKLYERIEERGIELNNQINTYHEKIQQTGIIAPKIKEALKTLYADMIDQTVCEEEITKIILSDCDKLLLMKPHHDNEYDRATGNLIIKEEGEEEEDDDDDDNDDDDDDYDNNNNNNNNINSSSNSSNSNGCNNNNNNSINSSSNNNNNQKRKRKEQQEIATLSSPQPKKLKKPVKNSKPNSIIKNGTIVAAKQPVTKSSEQNWILATVVGYKPEVKLYEVEDADQFEASNRHFNVPKKHVLPIANKGEVKANEFTKDHPVLALYTETTCFYKATVVLPPSKITPSKKDCYLLEFEDDGRAQRYVESQYVLDIPKV